jgi:hypothetical protein
MPNGIYSLLPVLVFLVTVTVLKTDPLGYVAIVGIILRLHGGPALLPGTPDDLAYAVQTTNFPCVTFSFVAPSRSAVLRHCGCSRPPASRERLKPRLF